MQVIYIASVLGVDHSMSQIENICYICWFRVSEETRVFFVSVWQTETEEMKKERVATYSAFLYVWYEAYVATKYDIACC